MSWGALIRVEEHRSEMSLELGGGGAIIMGVNRKYNYVSLP